MFKRSDQAVITSSLKFISVQSIVVCILLLVSAMATAQTIEKKTDANQQYDTASILQLLQEGTRLIDKSPDEALQSFTTAAERSRQLNYAKGNALSNARIARWYFGNNSDKSIAHSRLALRYFEADPNASFDDKAQVHLLLAETYDERGRQDSSAYYYYLISSEIESGNISNTQLSIDLYTKLVIFLINLEEGNDEREYLTTVKRYVDKARIAAASLKDSADAVSSLYFLQGAYYVSLKKFDSARYYYNTYLVERERLKKLVLPRKISTLVNIADSYLQQERPAEAIEYIRKVQALGNAPQKNKYLVFYLLFSDLMMGKALYQQHHYEEAIRLLNETLEKLKATGTHLRNEFVETYQILAASYEATGDYKNAVTQKNNFISLRDSLMKKDKINMISRLEMRYRIVEKDKALAEQKLRIVEIESDVQSRNYFIAGIVLLAVFITLGFGLWRRKNIHKQKLQQERIDNLQKKMEIERLNATIDGEEKERTRIARELHDGIGALLTAAKMNFELVKKSQDYEHNADFLEGIKLLEETASGLRETAHNIMPETLMQEGLSNAVKAFCERLTGKGGTMISFQTLGVEKTGAGFNLPVFRVVQELIHNIRKHANAATALVQMNFHETGALDITVEDDGIGMDTTLLTTSNGMGLKNINERVKQLGGRIDINSVPGKGTSIYLEFENAKNENV